MAGKRLRDFILAACMMALVIGSISVQLTLAGRMAGEDSSSARTVMAVAR